jgi:predicted glycosyl hydrolase (DUF1957 family)
MAQILWSNIIDFYQPPNINRSEFERIVNRSYIQIIKIFEQNPKLSTTINLPGSTIDLLIKTGFGKLINSISGLAERGQIDFTMTPSYQPMIPLTDDDDMDRQILAHNKICERYFGIYYKPQGLYSPYLAHSPKVSKVGARFALKWIAVDESVLGRRNYQSLFMDKTAGGILLMPVHREASNRLNGSFKASHFPKSASEFIQGLTKLSSDKHKYIITATEAQYFGHKHSGRQGLLRALFRENKIKAVSVSQLRKYVKRKEFAKPNNSSSETLINGNGQSKPFALWENNKNPIINSLWKMYKLASDEIRSAGSKGDSQYIRARNMLDFASGAANWSMSSCWPWWDKEYSLKVADDLAIAVFVLSSSSAKTKEKAIAMRQELHDTVEQFEKSGEPHKIQKNYLKTNKIPFDRYFKK